MADDEIGLALKRIHSDKPELRLAGCRKLISIGAINTAEPVLDTLAGIEAYAHEIGLLRGSCLYIRRVLNETKMTDAAGNPMLSDAAEREILAGNTFDDFYLLRREQGSANLIIVFTGMANQFGVSLALMQRILRRFDCHVIFLQDRQSQFYLGGVGGLGRSYRSTVTSLAQQASQLSVKNIFCLGQSAGGYASIQAGIELRANGVLAFVPFTTLEPLIESGRLPADGPGCGWDAALPRPLDLSVHIARADQLPHISIVYGAQSTVDVEQAQRLRHEAVEHIPIEGFATHGVFTKVVADNRFDDMISALFRSTPHVLNRER